jgi:hypothetical protein
MTTSTNRLDQIADRQRTSRVVDILFAGMIALLMTFFVASYGQANAKAMSKHSATPAAQTADSVAHVDGGACEPTAC